MASGSDPDFLFARACRLYELPALPADPPSCYERLTGESRVSKAVFIMLILIKNISCHEKTVTLAAKPRRSGTVLRSQPRTLASMAPASYCIAIMG